MDQVDSCWRFTHHPRLLMAVFTVASLVTAANASAAGGASGELVAKGLDSQIVAVIDKYRASLPITMAEQQVPGLAVAVVVGGRTAWLRGFGVTDGPGSQPVTPATMFSVQSISKTYTATAVMRAVAEGKLSLDAPITTYLPSFRVNSRFEAQPERRITLRLLLSHRSGLTHEAPLGSNFDRTATFDEHIRSISDTWLKFPVGQRFAYSNLGIDLAGRVLEVAYERPFEDVMAQQLFTPLELRETTVDQPLIRSSANRAVGHAKGYETVPVGMAMIPAGGVYTSARDIARFMQLHLDGGKVGERTLISRAALDAMYEACCNDELSTYGLGIGLSRLEVAGADVAGLGHGGGGDGFLADMYWYPEVGLGIAVLTNSDDHRLQGRLATAMAQDILSSLPTRVGRPTNADRARRTPVNVAELRMRQLAGIYLEERDIEFAFEDSKLCWKVRSGCHPVEFYSPDEIGVALPSMRLECQFQKDRDRDPSAAVCRLQIGSMQLSSTMPYNGSPDDQGGPDRPEWRTYLGDYEMWLWGKLSATYNVHVTGGYLYFGKYRVLDEHEPGLFFLADGEALDLRTTRPTYRNIPLRRAVTPLP